jgi:hypothetical protein
MGHIILPYCLRSKLKQKEFENRRDEKEASRDQESRLYCYWMQLLHNKSVKEI